MEDALFISVRGENAEEVPKELVIFLKFVKADLKESQEDFHDIYVKQLQNSIRHIKESREMEERFMILEEMLRDERAAGRREVYKKVNLTVKELCYAVFRRSWIYTTRT